MSDIAEHQAVLLDQASPENSLSFQEQQKKKENRRIWRFLNSPFGLWILSSMVFGFIAWGYGKIESIRKQEIHDKDEVIKLTFAIDAHIQDFLLGLMECHSYESYCEHFSDHLQNPKTYKFLCFKDLTMNDMLVSYKELKDKYSGITDADEIQQGIMKTWESIEKIKDIPVLTPAEKKAFDQEIHSCLERFAGNPRAVLQPKT